MSLILATVTPQWAAFASDGRVAVRIANTGEWRPICDRYRKVDRLPCGSVLATVGTTPFSDAVRSAAHQPASVGELIEMLPRFARTQQIDATLGHWFLLAVREAQRAHLYYFDSQSGFELMDGTPQPGRVTFFCSNVPPAGTCELVNASFAARQAEICASPAAALAFMREQIHAIALREPTVVSDDFFFDVLDDEKPPVQHRFEGTVAHSLDRLQEAR